MADVCSSFEEAANALIEVEIDNLKSVFSYFRFIQMVLYFLLSTSRIHKHTVSSSSTALAF